MRSGGLSRKGLPAAAALLMACFIVQPGQAAPAPVAVVATGSLPGIKDDDLTAYLARRMNEIGGGTWHFVPAQPGRSVALNRIEWSFKTNGSAVGHARTYGFSSAFVQRLIGAHEFLTVEATLYLDGEYQTKSLSQVNDTGGPTDPALVATLRRDTTQLIAYSTLDTRVDGIGPGGKRVPSP